MIFYDKAGHLISDESLEELHDFALNKLGFKVDWFQDHPTHPHYDLTTAKAKKRAEQAGAVKISSKEIVLKLRNLYGISRAN